MNKKSKKKKIKPIMQVTTIIGKDWDKPPELPEKEISYTDDLIKEITLDKTKYKYHQIDGPIMLCSCALEAGSRKFNTFLELEMFINAHKNIVIYKVMHRKDTNEYLLRYFGRKNNHELGPLCLSNFHFWLTTHPIIPYKYIMFYFKLIGK